MPKLFGRGQNFFKRVREVIQNVVDYFVYEEPIDEPGGPPPWEEEFEDDLDHARDIVMGHLEREQPYGRFEPAVEFYDKYGNITYQRAGSFPSDRMGHTPISEGWRTETVRQGDRMSLQFTNVSEHIFYILNSDGRGIGGDSPYKDSWRSDEHGKGPVVFWWGSPLPWHPSPPAQPGSNIFAYTERKRPEVNNFVERAIDEAYYEVSGTIQEGMSRVLIEVIQSHSGYRYR